MSRIGKTTLPLKLLSWCKKASKCLVAKDIQLPEDVIIKNIDMRFGTIKRG